ncbi:succinate dehydrogenase/fumarate reductase iron-sulfur subunit [Moorella stamsii]|uniref:succinate dehydrogenase/fumarate reductase iron-sulfur subunit n=1 Tax=Neomoorella stamsii TaxID=1266720 RepID=UPI0006D575CD|nr:MULTISPECIES: 2Fe-2S iron-sulfur cluster-binding protein [Moorella]
MSKKSFLASVYRYNPFTDRKPYYVKYEIEAGGKMKVLDVLRYIQRNFDGELAFRSSCGIGRCGSCAVVVNGKPVLSCKEYIENIDIVIEPLANYPVIKDLIIDREPYNNKLKHIRPFLENTARGTKQVAQEDYQQYKYFTCCVECLCCMSVCPSFSRVPLEFYGPCIFVQLARYKSHPLDGGARILMVKYGGLHNCISCKRCTAVCPQGIDIYNDVVVPFRTAILREGGDSF